MRRGVLLLRRCLGIFIGGLVVKVKLCCDQCIVEVSVGCWLYIYSRGCSGHAMSRGFGVEIIAD